VEKEVIKTLGAWCVGDITDGVNSLESVLGGIPDWAGERYQIMLELGSIIESVYEFSEQEKDYIKRMKYIVNDWQREGG